MSWQDELKELDGALAAGQISADEYRTRRDRVLAQASGQPPAPGPSGTELPPVQPTQMFAPAQPPAPPRGSEGFDRTHVVPGHQHEPGEPDKTQVVSSDRDSSADRTQIVPGNQATGTPPPGFPPPPPPPPWESVRQPPPRSQPMVGAAPPWANEDLPPDFGSQSWPRQGPEVFEEPAKGNAGKIIAIIVVAIVVLGGGGGAIWYFASQSKDNPQASGQTNAPQTTERKPPTTTKPPPNIPKGPFIELPGKAAFNSTLSIADAVATKVPTEAEAKLLQANGVIEVAGLVTEESGLRRGIWAFKLGGSVDATAVLTAMDKLYDQAKFTLGAGQTGVLVRKQNAADANSLTTIRAHYLTSDGYLVRVEAYGQDAAMVDTSFGDLLEQETRKYEPKS